MDGHPRRRGSLSESELETRAGLPRRPSRTSLKTVVLVFCAGAPSAVPGCAPRAGTLVPVSGAVAVEGKPLTIGWVTFYPDEAGGNKSSHLPWAEIKPDGTYELSTNGKPGASAGWYKVVVAATHDQIPVKPPRTKDGKPWQPRWLVHVKYTHPSTTDVRIEVVEKPAPGGYDLRLSR